MFISCPCNFIAVISGLFPLSINVIKDSHHLSETCRQELHKHVTFDMMPLECESQPSSPNIDTCSVMTTETQEVDMCDECGRPVDHPCE